MAMWKYSSLPFGRWSTWKQSPAQSQIQIPLLEHHSPQQTIQTFGDQMLKIRDAAHISKAQMPSSLQLLQARLSKWVIDADSKWLLLWNLLLLTTILYNFLQIPIVIFFLNYVQDDPYYESKLLHIDIAILYLYLMDILLIRWRVGFYQRQTKITELRAIYSEYLTTLFPFDLISFLGYSLFVAIQSVIYIKLIFLFKIVTFIAIDIQVERKLEMYRVRVSIYKFIRLIAFIVLVTNFVACIFFVIDYQLYLQKGFEEQYGFLWLTGSSATQDLDILTNWPWYVWYEYAMYFSVMTTTTIGYGNLTARNPSEVLFTLGVILINLGVFSYFTNGILNIIEEFRWKQSLRQEQQSVLSRYIYLFKIRNPQKSKSRYYLQKKLKYPLQEVEQQIEVFLSEGLKVEFRLNYHREFWDHMPLMKQLFKSNDESWSPFAEEMVLSMKFRYLTFGQQIHGTNKSEGIILALITRGIVTVFNRVTYYEKHLVQWQYLGQRQFFLGGSTLNQSICRTFTRIHYCQRQDFLGVIKKYPTQNQIFMFYFEGIRFNHRSGELMGIRCCLCDEYHLEENCPLNQSWREQIRRYKQQQARYPHSRLKLSRLSIKCNRRTNLNTRFRLQVDTVTNFLKYFPFFNLDSFFH